MTLSNGSVLIELADLRLSQRIARSPLLGPAFGRLDDLGHYPMLEEPDAWSGPLLDFLSPSAR